MNKCEVHHKSEGIAPNDLKIWGRDSLFDYAVFAPEPPFAYGKLVALLFEKEHAECFAASMNLKI